MIDTFAGMSARMITSKHTHTQIESENSSSFSIPRTGWIQRDDRRTSTRRLKKKRKEEKLWRENGKRFREGRRRDTYTVVKRRRFRFRERTAPKRFGVRTRFADHRTGGTASLYEAWLEAGSSPSTTGASFRIGHDPALDYRSASKGSLG